MTTIAESICRGDYEFNRHGDADVGVLWEELIDGSYSGKDLSGWTAELTLESDQREKLAAIDCTCTSDGYTIAKIPASVLETELGAHTFGRWRIVGTDGSATKVIGGGNFAIIE